MAIERTRQQRTPGQFGVDATGLSSPNTSAAAHIQQGVVDQSGAIATENLTNIVRSGTQAAQAGIKIASDIRDGFQLADLEKQLENNIESFLDSRNNPTRADEAALDASTLTKISEGLWDRLGSGASIEDIDAVEKQYQETMSKYQKAVSQGVMSIDEFNTKALSITREAINRNPALYDQIITHGKKVMGLSGMDNFLKAEQAAAQDAEKMMEDRIKANSNYLYQNNQMPKYLRNGEYDLETNEATAQAIASERFYADTMKRAGDIRSEREAAEAADFMNRYGVQGVNGLVNEVNRDAIALIEQNKGNPLPIIRQMYEQTLQQITARAGRIMHKDGVSDVVSYAEKRINSQLDMLTKLTNNDDIVDFLKNEEEIGRNREMVNLRKIVPIETIKLTNQIMASIGGAALLSKDAELYGKTVKSLSNLVNRVQNSYDTDYTALDGSGRNAVSSAIKTLAGLVNKDADEAAKEGLDSIVDTVFADTRLNNKFKTVEDRYKFYSTLIQGYGAEGMDKIGEVARGKAAENVEDYMRITMEGFNKDLASLRDRGIEVQMNLLPDGRISMKTSNQQETDNLVSRYQTRINDSLRAFAKLSGSTTERVADDFYNQYEPIKGLSKINVAPTEENPENKPNKSNPLNLTIPGKQGQFQTFPTTDDGIRAASAQLDRYYQGKTTGKPLQTVSQIVGTWNNENEKGSMSKKDYVATVTRFSGLDANSKLDLTDPYVKADLMYGMAKAEGSKLRPSQIYSALGLK